MPSDATLERREIFDENQDGIISVGLGEMEPLRTDVGEGTITRT